MNTQQIIDLALELAGMPTIPPDSAIYQPKEDVRSIYLGIDIAAEDLTHAKQRGCDLVIGHHPLNRLPWLGVLDRHIELMTKAGVSSCVANDVFAGLKENAKAWAEAQTNKEIYKELTPMAQSLGVGLMNIHLPCDEIGRQVLQREADAIDPSSTVSQLKEHYSHLPEIGAEGEQVEVISADPSRPIGKTVVIHAAGTNGGYAVANALFESGVDTVVYIHFYSDEERRKIKNEGKGNVIVTGHYGSDSLGINPLVDELEAKGITVYCCNQMFRAAREHRTTH